MTEGLLFAGGHDHGLAGAVDLDDVDLALERPEQFASGQVPKIFVTAPLVTNWQAMKVTK